jgi:hypothetical protein
METFTTFLDGQNYQVSFHPHIGKFIIIQHHTGLHLMYLQPDNTWRCLNRNPFCVHLPASSLYEESLQKKRAGFSHSI